MNNYSHSGEARPFVAGATVTAGVPVLQSGLLVIPTVDAETGETFTALVRGVFTGLAKTTGEAWVAGQKLYWVTGTSKFSTTAGGNQLVGTANAAAESAATTGDVALDGVTR